MKTWHLTVDDDPRPMGLDAPVPAFRWLLEDTRRGQGQTAFRLHVFTMGEGGGGRRETVWDSGKTDSGESAYIPYGGAALQSGRRYGWQVKVWDREGVESDWSDPAWFDTGLLNPSDWTARWIGAGPVREPQLEFQDTPNAEAAEKLHGPITVESRSLLLRSEWNLDRPVRRVMAYVTGLGFYELRVNGQRVGRKVMNPAKTDFRKQVLYDAYEVTGLLQPGANALGLMLGNGWYNPAKKYWDWRMQWHGSKRAVLQLHLEHTDGTMTRLVTDENWRVAAGPVLRDCIYDGETFDAREVQEGWDRPGFNAAGWTPAVVMPAPGGRLRHQSLPAIEVTQTLQPAALWETDPGVFLFDFGQNFSGWCRLRVSGARGTAIHLRHAENIDADGRLDPRTNMAALNEDVYILVGAGQEESFEPHFTYHGFQYVEMKGFPGVPSLDCLTGCVTHTASRQTGSFQCAHRGINHIQHCTLWSQRSNMMGMPTDDNQRDERLGWLGDAHVTAQECLWNFDAVRFYRKWLLDLKHGQNPETGDVPHVCPRPSTNGTPCWSSAYPLVAWYVYQHTGDQRFLSDHFGNIRKYADFLATRAVNGIQPRDRYGDWANVTDHAVNGEPEMASSFFYYYSTWIAAEAARRLGQHDMAQQYEERAGGIRAAMLTHFFDAGKVRYGRGSVCETAMAIWLDLVPAEACARMTAHLLDEVGYRRGGHLPTGILGTQYVFDVLNKAGHNATGWALATVEGFPGFLEMTRGRTTLSEHWDQGGTNNHIMFGSISHWFYRALAGLQLVEGATGFRRVRIAPLMPPDLAWAAGAIETVRGRIASAWRRHSGNYELDVAIPTGVEAEVRLPAVEAHGRILEGNTVIWDAGFRSGADGVRAGRLDGSVVVLEVESGEYHFKAIR